MISSRGRSEKRQRQWRGRREKGHEEKDILKMEMRGKGREKVIVLYSFPHLKRFYSRHKYISLGRFPWNLYYGSLFHY